MTKQSKHRHYTRLSGSLVVGVIIRLSYRWLSPVSPLLLRSYEFSNVISIPCFLPRLNAMMTFFRLPHAKYAHLKSMRDWHGSLVRLSRRSQCLVKRDSPLIENVLGIDRSHCLGQIIRPGDCQILTDDLMGRHSGRLLMSVVLSRAADARSHGCELLVGMSCDASSRLSGIVFSVANQLRTIRCRRPSVPILDITVFGVHVSKNIHLLLPPKTVTGTA